MNKEGGWRKGGSMSGRIWREKVEKKVRNEKLRKKNDIPMIILDEKLFN